MLVELSEEELRYMYMWGALVGFNHTFQSNKSEFCEKSRILMNKIKMHRRSISPSPLELHEDMMSMGYSSADAIHLLRNVMGFKI